MALERVHFSQCARQLFQFIPFLLLFFSFISFYSLNKTFCKMLWLWGRARSEHNTPLGIRMVDRVCVCVRLFFRLFSTSQTNNFKGNIDSVVRCARTGACNRVMQLTISPNNLPMVLVPNNVLSLSLLSTSRSLSSVSLMFKGNAPSTSCSLNSWTHRGTEQQKKGEKWNRKFYRKGAPRMTSEVGIKKE